MQDIYSVVSPEEDNQWFLPKWSSVILIHYKFQILSSYLEGSVGVIRTLRTEDHRKPSLQMRCYNYSSDIKAPE